MKKLCSYTVMIVCCCLSLVARASDTQSIIAALKTPGHVALMRHAIAPGGGDPDNFVLRDCTSQRNLDDSGRDQAREIGDFLRDSGIAELSVYSSQWCRCLDTARLLGFGDVEELPFLNSFFRQRERAAQQTRELHEWLFDSGGTTPTMLVTHQVNITALTDVFPGSGEIVVIRILKDGATEVVGTIQR